jgi:hypothetical protein
MNPGQRIGLTAVLIYIEKIERQIFSIPIPPLFVSTRVKLCLHRVTHVGRDARRSPLVENPRFSTSVKFAIRTVRPGLDWPEDRPEDLLG